MSTHVGFGWPEGACAHRRAIQTKFLGDCQASCTIPMKQDSKNDVTALLAGLETNMVQPSRLHGRTRVTTWNSEQNQ